VRVFELLFFQPNYLRTTLITVVFLVPMASICAQTPVSTATPAETNQSAPEANGDIDGLETRIQRARALAAAHQLQPAINELEAVRRVASDDVIRNVTSVMLMGIYLEEGNYIRAQALLDEDFRARTSGRDASLRTYFAIAGQAINSARLHLARYRSFGINVSDQYLPAEAISDLDKLRSLLERMAAQAKEIVAERKGYDSLALLEDVIGVRLSIARDAEDRGTWEAEYATAREGLALSQMQIASLAVPTLSGGTQPVTNTPAKKEPPQAAKEPTVAASPSQTQVVAAALSSPDSPPSAAAATEGEDGAGEIATISTGLLNSRASKRVVPTYPPTAKSSGVTGIVRVHILVDQSGRVAEVRSSEGPVLLRTAAEQAARGWRFPPTVSNNKPVQLSGYIEFNFTH
jgi:TonB family protein